jgi:class III poly(R)-hydroxyalkanoic acid synthase PhaE subunit
MADKRSTKGNTTGTGSTDWQDMAGRVSEAWSSAAQRAMSALPGGMGAQFGQWADSLKGAVGGAASGVSPTAERVVAGAQQFMSMLQGMVGQLGQAVPGPDSWRGAMGAAMGGFDVGSNPVLDALKRAVGEGSRGFETLHAQFMQQSSPLRAELQASLSMPNFGMNREEADRRQALALALVEYQKQLGGYNALMLEASRIGFQRMESKLEERSEPGRTLKSFREFYDLWIDAAEEGYAEVALSERFQASYGALVNAQFRVRKLMQDEVERATTALGMPGRTELDAAHRKIDALRRRINRIEAQGDDEASAPAANRQTPAANESAAPKPASKPRKAAAAKAKAPARKPKARQSSKRGGR